jgi:hypothetical protein
MSGAASNGRFDLDAAALAAAAETAPVPFLFTYKGEDYSVPPATSWPLEAQALVASGDLDRALTSLLGAESYARLLKAGMTVGELNILFTAVGEAAGVESLPNLSAPAAHGSTPT